MTDRLAIIFGLLILAALAVDWFSFDMAYSLFLARKFVLFIEYLAFWR